ncbi:MAG: DUF423 domain-containing protein [Rhodanobacteraceae bacterium]
MAAVRVRRGWQGVVLGTLGASAVALGAFGAHALRNTLPPASMDIWRTAVQYHFWHTLAFALAAMMQPSFEKSGQDDRFLIFAPRTSAPAFAARIAMWLFAIGVLLFCGSLYALALGAPRWVGAITPFGGVAFILGWIALGVALIRIR